MAKTEVDSHANSNNIKLFSNQKSQNYLLKYSILTPWV